MIQCFLAVNFSSRYLIECKSNAPIDNSCHSRSNQSIIHLAACIDTILSWESDPHNKQQWGDSKLLYSYVYSDILPKIYYEI